MHVDDFYWNSTEDFQKIIIEPLWIAKQVGDIYVI